MVFTPQACPDCQDGKIYGTLAAMSQHVRDVHKMDWLVKAEHFSDLLTSEDKTKLARLKEEAEKQSAPFTGTSTGPKDATAPVDPDHPLILDAHVTEEQK